MPLPRQAHPPDAAGDKLRWYAMRYERWNDQGERIGLLPRQLENLSGAMGSAAVALVAAEEQPDAPEERKVLFRAIEGLDRAGGAALEAILDHAEADPAPGEVLRRAMLLEEPGTAVAAE